MDGGGGEGGSDGGAVLVDADARVATFVTAVEDLEAQKLGVCSAAGSDRGAAAEGVAEIVAAVYDVVPQEGALESAVTDLEVMVGVGKADHAVADRAVPEDATADRAAPEDAAPEQAVAEKVAPEHAVAEEAVAEVAAPELAVVEHAAVEHAVAEEGAESSISHGDKKKLQEVDELNTFEFEDPN